MPPEIPEHHDVLIVGAGLSGVGAACHLQMQAPHRSYAVLEAREALGGTWDLFRYPGIRSDSDAYTLGYSFKPWGDDKAIVPGASILAYIEETAREHAVTGKIRFGHRVVGAAWSSPSARWTVEVEQPGASEPLQMTCNFLFWCSGYYRYDEGFRPHFEGSESFRGEILHPQHWPADLDYAGKRVVVIGSGATAVTLVPALAQEAAHVTMLQRSPTYVISLPAEDRVAKNLRRYLGEKAAYSIVRWKNVLRTMFSFELSRRRPELVKRFIRRGVEMQLPPGFDVDLHFTPRYNPWDQRLCLVPDGDLFAALQSGRASIVTDRVGAITERGVKLASGPELEADVIVTATGLNMQLLSGVPVRVDGRLLDPADGIAYKGMMLSGVPNMAFAIGYTNASWTLKCDLVCEYVCRLLNHMAAHGYDQCMPVAPDTSEPLTPIIDFQSGYVLRALSSLPKQGARKPWRLHQNYFKDIALFRRAPLHDAGMSFSRAPLAADEPAVLAAA